MLDYNLVLKSDELYLVGDINSDGSGESATGLYVRDTRFLSLFRISLNEKPLELLSARVQTATAATVTATNPALKFWTGDELRPHSVLVEQRITLDSTFCVVVHVESYAALPITIDLSIEFDSDFRDLFDIRGFRRERRGRLQSPRLDGRTGVLSYVGLDDQLVETIVKFDRDPVWQLLHVDVNPAPANPVDAHKGVAVRFPVSLDTGESWDLEIVVHPKPVGESPEDDRIAPSKPRAWIETDNILANRVLRRCDLDLVALLTRFPEGQIPAAGIPWYVAPFGRDSLIVGLQTLFLMPEQASGTLRVLAALQGKEVERWREEEPGKILHEMRYGEMARLGEVPHSPYFGTVDATPLFVWLFAEAVDWTGDDDLYRDLLPHVRNALAWVERYGDKDGDGLIEYQTDNKGLGQITHQVWKDSYDSLHYPDGRPVEGLITPVEVQGYLYAAYRRLADVVAARGDSEWAAELRAKAESVRQTVEEKFWLSDSGYYAQALGPDKHAVEVISSNGGQLLLTGLPAPERAALVAQRLAEPDLNSGWGIRTLSADDKAYNPMSYHNGSVWPHDNSLIGAGLYQVGEADGAQSVFNALFAVAQSEPLDRLPELYCGFARLDESEDEPVPYPVSCSPQAWAAGSIPLLMRAMLGLKPDPDGHNRLLVSPAFPSWLSEVTMHDLDFRGQQGTIVVRRDQDQYRLDFDGIDAELVELLT